MKEVGNGSTGMMSAMSDALVRAITWQRCLAFVGGLALGLVFFSGVQSPSAQKWLQLQVSGTSDDSMTATARDAEKKWSTWTTRAAEWQSTHAIDDQNWAGRQRMHNERVNGSLWWDEKAEQYFVSKLEESQFPANCSQAHWIAHYDFVAGLLSSVHLFLLPLFFAMVRGHTLVPISEPKRHPAFDGCGSDPFKHNMQCYFNITSCDPEEDPSRMKKILSVQHDKFRTSWEEVLMEDDEFFPEAGVTVVQTWKQHTWATEVCVASSSFSSFLEAYTFHKLNLWDEMGRHGKVGVVKGYDANGKEKCSGEDSRQRRVDMVMTSLMSSWMLNRVPNDVKLVADEIMSRYVDSNGQAIWKAPVLAIHVRQTDKSTEDPYYQKHGTFRPIESYALDMKQMEEEHGFEWPTIFLLSDSGTAMESLITVINGNGTTPNPDGNSTSTHGDKRYIMYDWTADDHLQEKYKDHSKVPRSLKHDMQIHFLASLYILQNIADHAIVTYSSNVGRFIGEIMAAKHRVAFVDPEGPFVTSLDYPWFWA